MYNRRLEVFRHNTKETKDLKIQPVYLTLSSVIVFLHMCFCTEEIVCMHACVYAQ